MNAPLTRFEILSGAQAVEDICCAMLKAAGAALQAHGDDPTAPAIAPAKKPLPDPRRDLEKELAAAGAQQFVTGVKS